MFQAIEDVAMHGKTAKYVTQTAPRPAQSSRLEPDAAWCSTNGKVFVVDDDYFVRQVISGWLQDVGLDVDIFASCEEFLEAHRQVPNTCLVLDVHFPGMGGLALLRHMDDVADSTPVIIVSGSSAISEAVLAMKKGALDLSKSRWRAIS